MTPPRHGGQLHQIAQRFGVPVDSLIDFSANINPEEAPSSVVAALRLALQDPATLSLYPDMEELCLRQTIGAYAGVSADAVVVANGFVQLLDAALNELQLRSCLLPIPSFGEYSGALARGRVGITPCVLDEGKDFRYQTSELLAALHGGGHDAILLANPQNPSGVLLDRVEMIAFIEACAAMQVWVLLDEAFIDYCPGQSLVEVAEYSPNLIVFRSVTKFYGMPGLRVAYAVAAPQLRTKIAAQLPPWAITTLAAVGVQAALADDAFAERTLRVNVERRRALLQDFGRLGIHCYPGAANFLLLRTETAEEWWPRLIVDHGLVLRHCGSFASLSTAHLRVAIRSEGDNARLVAAIRAMRTEER